LTGGLRFRLILEREEAAEERERQQVESDISHRQPQIHHYEYYRCSIHHPDDRK
jgi:hypothetical protein